MGHKGPVNWGLGASVPEGLEPNIILFYSNITISNKDRRVHTYNINTTLAFLRILFKGITENIQQKHVATVRVEGE
jgi:hypothetical protein